MRRSVEISQVLPASWKANRIADLAMSLQPFMSALRSEAMVPHTAGQAPAAAVEVATAVAVGIASPATPKIEDTNDPVSGVL